MVYNMRLAAKLNIGVLAVFVVSVATNYLVLHATIKPKFDDIEIAASQRNHERILDAIATLSATLGASAQDYAFWDNCYDFAQGKDTDEFIKSTLTPPDKMLENVSVDAAIFIGPKKEILWSAAIDQSAVAGESGILPDLLGLNYNHPYLSGTGELKVKTGVIKTSKGLALLAVAPIVKGDHTGNPVGTVLMAKLIDAHAIEELTHVHFRLNPLADDKQLAESGTTLKTFEDNVETSSVISDILGKPLALLQTSTPRDVSKAGANSIASATWLMMAAAALVILALWLFVNLMVVARVAALKRHFAHAIQSGRVSETRGENANDEIGALAVSFNELARHVNEMRDALTDSAYLSGVSEWATGTLHNVRNGLTPINAYAGKIQDLFDQRWRQNLQLAIAQIDDPNTPPERREKLNNYIVVGSQRMLECVGQTQKMTDEILAASKSVEDMVSEYERLGRKETEVEAIDAAELIHSVAKAVVAPRSPNVRLSLPETSTLFCGNRIILRQILANLLVNALEALQSKSGEKEIRVELRAFDGDSGNLELLVSDNGEGIVVENLKSIFQRGYSTRKHRKGGLGLHWCANAAKAMGGSLRAESDGPGTGATLVIRLPVQNSTTSLLEAA